MNDDSLRFDWGETKKQKDLREKILVKLLGNRNWEYIQNSNLPTMKPLG